MNMPPELDNFEGHPANNSQQFKQEINRPPSANDNFRGSVGNSTM